MKIIISLLMLNTLVSNTIPMKYAPVRISKSATIMLNEPVAKVFPLFGPVREMEWADGWQPEVLYGQQEVEPYMIFRTKNQDEHYQWIVTQYDPENYLIEYTVSAPGRVWFIRVACKAHVLQTLATVTYTYTGLTEEGHRRNRAALDNMFASNLDDWEEAINHYLSTGKKLKH